MSVGKAIGDALRGGFDAYAWMTGLQEDRKRREEEQKARAAATAAAAEDRQFRRDQASRGTVLDVLERVGPDTPLDEPTVAEGQRLGLGGLFDARTGTLGGTDWSGMTGPAGASGGPALQPRAVPGQAAGTYRRPTAQERAAADTATQQSRYRGTLPAHLRPVVDAAQMGVRGLDPEDFIDPGVRAEQAAAAKAAERKASLADFMERERFRTGQEITRWDRTTGSRPPAEGRDPMLALLPLYNAEIARRKANQPDAEIDPVNGRKPRPALNIPSFAEWARTQQGLLRSSGAQPVAQPGPTPGRGPTTPMGSAGARPQVGAVVTLKDGSRVTITAINPDGTFDYE